MPVSIEIPLPYYQAFIGRCDLESREYHVLRNAVIQHVPEHRRDGNVAILLCSEVDAALLLRRAVQFYPTVASYIEEALRSGSPRDTPLAADRSLPPKRKTLGDILFADAAKNRISENDWVQLLQELAGGDERALHSLYQRTCGIVFTLIVRLTANRETAEEVTLEAFRDIRRQASTYDPAAGSVTGWIMNQARAKATEGIGLKPTARSFNKRSVDVLQPPQSLWGRLALRIARETGTRPFIHASQTPVEPEWEQAAPGIRVKILSRNAENESVSMLVRLAPKTDYPGHTHAGVEELHLLNGILKVDDRTFYPGDFLHSEADRVDHRVWSETGCTCFLTTSTKDCLL